MQRQTIRKAIVKTLLVAGLMAPLVSYSQEHSSNKNRISEISFDASGERDTLTGKTERDTTIAKLFDAARDRRSRIILNPIEIIEGYGPVETKSIFIGDSWKKITGKANPEDKSFLPSVSKAMMDLSLKKTKKQWGFCFSDSGIGIRYGKNGEDMTFDIYSGNSASNIAYSMNSKRTRVYHSKLKGYEFNWISACCEMIDKDSNPCQYLILAFTNLYPGTPKDELKVLASILKLPEDWKLMDESSLLGVSACDAIMPSAYFTAQDSYRRSYEIFMLGYTYIKDMPRENVRVFIRDGNGMIVELK